MKKSRPTALKCILLGGGGHARVVLDCLLRSRQAVPLAILDGNPDLWKKNLQGVPILGDDRLILELIRKGANCFTVAVGSTGDCGPRRRLFDALQKQGLKPLTVMHPSSLLSEFAMVGAGCQLLPGAIVNAGAILGDNVIINSGAIVEHDCRVGSHVHVATGARLCGAVIVGDGAHIGAGATIKEGLKIGRNAIVGAGAVAIRDVPARAAVAGVPAVLLRSIEQERERP
jgi:UDP-perosamine 4-acetyltransferase